MSVDIMDTWVHYEGREFLKDIGMKKDQYVLDFGCGNGAYTLPSSLVVGKNGRIYSVDKNEETLSVLQQKMKKEGLTNVEILQIVDERELPLSGNSIDMILLYDVLHLVESRERLLSELHRVLKSNRILSIYPKHHQTHMNMNLKEVITEIESADFQFDTKLFKTLMHDSQLEEGYVLNFRKL